MWYIRMNTLLTLFLIYWFPLIHPWIPYRKSLTKSLEFYLIVFWSLFYSWYTERKYGRTGTRIAVALKYISWKNVEYVNLYLISYENSSSCRNSFETLNRFIHSVFCLSLALKDSFLFPWALLTYLLILKKQIHDKIQPSWSLSRQSIHA